MYYYSYYDSETDKTIALFEESPRAKKCGDIVILKEQRYRISGYKLEGDSEGFFVDKLKEE